MKFPEVESSTIYGQPYQTPDGATVITVARGPGRGGSRPMGVFVIKNGQASWEPAVDVTRIAFIGVLTGLVAAALATAAMLRRPPWPDVRITQHRERAPEILLMDQVPVSCRVISPKSRYTRSHARSAPSNS